MSTADPSIARRLAERLAAHAASVLPRDRVDWAQAMRREIDHLPRSSAALQWALGCVLASYVERMTTMTTDRFGASRWVLSLWMLCCFVWDSMVFAAGVSSALLGLDASGPLPFNGEFWLRASGAALGPIGLVVAFKSVVLGRPALSHATIAIIGIAALATLVEAGVVFATHPHSLETWQGYVLLAALPVLGAAHLIWLGKPAPARAATA